MADYYELLGVDVDAPVDDIRAAYRDKKAAVADSGTDAAKADAAALNKAWNVLSDPYQRGRYDEQRANVGDDGGAEDDDDDAEADAKPLRRSSKADARAKNSRRQPLQPTVKLPAGMGFPATRRRIIAMLLDLAVLLVLFVASQFLTVSMEKSQHRAVYDRATKLTQTIIPDAHKATSDANKKQSAADNVLANLTKTKGAQALDTQNAQVAANEAKQKATDAKNAEAALNTELDRHSKVLSPVQNLVSGGFFLASLFVLLIPSLFGGATFGKRRQRIRVVRIDGSPARAGDLFRRYGLMVFVAFALSFLLRSPVGGLIVVFVATMWTRNPNQQGLQDRFAKTLVVTDE
jgi:curved DNA-binding protein CbpA